MVGKCYENIVVALCESRGKHLSVSFPFKAISLFGCFIFLLGLREKMCLTFLGFSMIHVLFDGPQSLTLSLSLSHHLDYHLFQIKKNVDVF